MEERWFKVQVVLFSLGGYGKDELVEVTSGPQEGKTTGEHSRIRERERRRKRRKEREASF